MTQIKGDQSKFKDTIITGVNSWGGVPSNAATTINVSAGNGDIIDSTTNRRAIVRTHVIWAEDATFSITMGTTFGVAYVYVDSAGVIQQQAARLSRAELRTKIFLCTVEFLSGAIAAVVEGPKMQQSVGTLLIDLLDFTPDSSKIQGAIISPVDAQLQAFREAGTFFEPGISTTATPNDPNVVTIAADGNSSTPMAYIVLTQDGGLDSSGTETFPKLRNTTGSTTVALTGNKATIHYFGVLGGINILQMGQVEYSTGATAAAAAESDANNFTFAPGFENTILLAQIVISAPASDFTDASSAQILNRKAGGAAGGAGGTDLTIDDESFTIISGSNTTTPLIESSAIDRTINKVTVKTDSGTITLDFQIDDISIVGLDAIAVTNVQQTVSATAAKALAAGARLTVIGTNNTGATRISVSIEVGRTDFIIGDENFTIPEGANETITIIEFASYERNINEFDGRLFSGTATWTVEIDGTPITGLTNLSMTTSPLNAIASAANVLGIGQSLTIVQTDAETSFKGSASLKQTRT